MKKVCRKCRLFVEGNKCPICGGDDFTTTHSGAAEIVDPDKSEIAEEMGIQTGGKFALRVR